MTELINSLNAVLVNMNTYCDKTACLHCLPRIERGKCTYDEIMEIRDLLHEIDE